MCEQGSDQNILTYLESVCVREHGSDLKSEEFCGRVAKRLAEKVRKHVADQNSDL